MRLYIEVLSPASKSVGANAHINAIAFMELVSVRIEAKREGFDHYLAASAGLVI